MMTEPGSLEKLKAAMRGTWMAGDFGKIAQFAAPQAEIFVDRLKIEPGMQVLDVACGTGNLAIPASRQGAQVTGIDIAPNLLEQARQRAAAESLPIVFEEGDAEQLPYPDESFEVVMTMFGAMFAPQPDRVAAELARVCRSGGRVAMANWTPEGFAGAMLSISRRYLPPPEGIPPPILWGDAAIARQRLTAHGLVVETTRRGFRFDFPFLPRDVVQFFREYFGPTRMAFARMDPATQKLYADDLEKFWSDHNEDGEGRTVIENEYLEVIGRKP
jgi:SAM-dependent methyltransferase